MGTSCKPLPVHLPIHLLLRAPAMSRVPVHIRGARHDGRVRQVVPGVRAWADVARHVI